MANETQNCGYPKPDTDDFYNIEDFNRAIDMIDGDIGEIQEAVSALGDGKADKKDVSQHLSTENPHNITKETVGLGNVPNVATDDQTPTFTQAASRENIASGERLSTIFGKIRKWFADLKAVAFTGSYNDLADRPEIPAATRVKGNAESSYRMGDVNITPADIGLGNVNNTADSVKNVNSAGNLRVLNDNYKQGTDLPSTYPRGVTVFFSIDPANKFNGITYCTIHTIKGYNNMACIQFLYPYNTDHDKVYFREALYNNDAWRPWHEVITTANIASQNVASATKATQDGSGNVIADTYAKKSIYGDGSVSLGRKSNSTKGANSFAVGTSVMAISPGSHAEGGSTTASGTYSHAEGGSTTASGDCSHAEGGSTTARSTYSHAEGGSTTASGIYSHAEGSGTTASDTCSHAEGLYTTARNIAAHASGKFNKSMVEGGINGNQAGDVFVIGNGTGENNRSNALRVTYKGDVLGTKAFQSSGADYAEFIKPWADGNPGNEDRVGYFVTIKDGLLHKAQAGDYIAGITSGNPSVVGNADEDYYWRYERDAFNRIVMEDVPELVQETDGDGNLVFDEETHEPIMAETGNIIKNARMKLADGYDPALQESYIPRAERPEWSYVGMLGVLPVRDDGTCVPGRFCRCGAGGTATLAEERGTDTFFVIERKTDRIVSVIVK